MSFFNTFMVAMTDELARAGMSEKDIHILSNDPELLQDAQYYWKEEGMDGREYAEMILNQWSGVQKHQIRENMKLVKESLNESWLDYAEIRYKGGYVNDLDYEDDIISTIMVEVSEEEAYDAMQLPGAKEIIVNGYENEIDPEVIGQQLLQLFYKEYSANENLNEKVQPTVHPQYFREADEEWKKDGLATMDDRTLARYLLARIIKAEAAARHASWGDR